MKVKILFSIGLLLCIALISKGQGLKQVTVEKYYISDQNDTLGSGRRLLPAGSVTYRVFVEMHPGYRLQAVYGSGSHELMIGTTTFFYNHPNYGQYIPNLIMDFSLKYNTVMLDSWLSMGAGSQDSYGILKMNDDTLLTVVNNFQPPLLQNENPDAGFPLKFRDGLAFGLGKPPRVTMLGMDSLLAHLNKIVPSDTGFVYKTRNGSWACLEGATGPDTTNKVLIGQFTTTGIFSFELNMQLGKPGGGVEQYVARNPSGTEILNKSLLFSSDDRSGDLQNN